MDLNLIVAVSSIIIPIVIMFVARAMDRGVKKGDDFEEDVEAFKKLYHEKHQELLIKVERIEERLNNHIEIGRHVG